MRIRFYNRNNILFPEPRTIQIDGFEMRSNALLVKVGQFTKAIIYDSSIDAWKFDDTYFNNFEVTDNPIKPCQI